MLFMQTSQSEEYWQIYHSRAGFEPELRMCSAPSQARVRFEQRAYPGRQLPVFA